MIPNSEVGTVRRTVRGRLGEATLPEADLRPVNQDIFFICVKSVAFYSFSFVHFASFVGMRRRLDH